uniref:Coatomer subunit gamma n=1 Tax=Elaeophora elaphi TaxID=1147741 RepID=A0A0R3RYG9_9BILA
MNVGNNLLHNNSGRTKMGKKGRSKNRKGGQKDKQLSKESKVGGSDFDEGISSAEKSSSYSAKTVNCMACLKPKNEPPCKFVRKIFLKLDLYEMLYVPINLIIIFFSPKISSFSDSEEPDINKIMDAFRTKATAENFKHSLQLINELVDNYDISGKIAEMNRQGMEIIFTQGMKFRDPIVQYYATHALAVLVKHMNETQLKNLLPYGLMEGISVALRSEMFFIVQEAFEVCSSIALKSVAMRDILAAFGPLHASELLSKYCHIIPREFASVIATFLCDLCYFKPVPESILKRVANGARFLLQHEMHEIRLAALNAILKVASCRNFTVIFEDAYVEVILKFLDSTRSAEVRAAFSITSEFVRQRNCNTTKVIRAGFIEKILPVLARNSSPDYGYDACSILARILSNKKYIESTIKSGLGTSLYKIKAYKALACMYGNIDRKNAIRLADQVYLEKICSILVNDNHNGALCALALMSCILDACSNGEFEKKLKETTKFIRESKAYEYIIQHANGDCYKTRDLAENLYHQLSDNVKNDAGELANF